jgi:ABC-type lipoprotein release transport system permease subunit
MLELVLANLRTRPFRSLISVIGVALGVVLILLFTGLARGMSDDMAKRAANLNQFKHFGFNDLRTASA